ncbi:MAG: roadblock/LC7 domain-containing protein [Acidimicrobiales bacterium]
MSTPEARSVNWLVIEFVQSVPGVRDAAVVSSDGLLIASSEGLDREVGDRLAAVSAGMISMARGVAEPVGAGRVNDIVIEMDAAFYLVTSVSEGSCLAVIAHKSADVGMVAYEMALLAERAGAALTPTLVAELQATLRH